MKHLTFYFDVISPYAYLAFEAMPEFLKGHSHSVTYKPVLFAALLKHHGQLGPAEIAGKREWTYRQVLWLAQRQNTPLQITATHPFNPLGLLRLALACATPGDFGALSPNRHACEAIFRHVWQGGTDAADIDRLAALTAALAPARVPASDAVKAELKSNCEEAIALGVFGVPTFAVDSKLFWGLDALPMLRDYLNAEVNVGGWFQTDAWAQAAQVPIGQARRQVENKTKN